jgi:hypothetical protein
MRELNYELKQMCERNRDGSYGKKDARERILSQIATQLHQLGFKHLSADSLKPKHIEALVAHWQAENLSPGTIKNRMCELRWWAEKVSKENVIAKSNDHYAIDKRIYVTNASKARSLETTALQLVTDPYSAMSLRFQEHFGLRREESIKIRPRQADAGDHLVLQASWTKGGRARDVPILTQEQRVVLNEAKEFATKGSLIPADLMYVNQLKRFEYQCGKAGIDHVHGLRHLYAQRRYLDITGRHCPAAGGLCSKQLTSEQKKLDREARLRISLELGHEREQITAIYLGR